MSKYITPTLTLVSNASTATTVPGPLSVALSLAATQALHVKAVQSKIATVTAANDQVLWDDAAFIDADNETAGTDGGFVYVKNVHASAHIYLGHGVAGALEGVGTAARIMTLLPGEFAFFPWDFTADIIVDASAAAADGVETWVFTRHQ
jgi:hypothetical protein